MDPLVSTAWLAERIEAPLIRVVDATYFLPGVPRDAHAEFLAGHIPGAQRFDIEKIAYRPNPLPTMPPSPEHLARHVGKKRQLVLHDLRVVDGHVVGKRADVQLAAAFRDLIQTFDAVDVDEGPGLGPPQARAGRGRLPSYPPGGWLAEGGVVPAAGAGGAASAASREGVRGAGGSRVPGWRGWACA